MTSTGGESTKEGRLDYISLTGLERTETDLPQKYNFPLRNDAVISSVFMFTEIQ